MSLSPYEVLTISAVLIGALVTIWGVLLRKEFATTIGEFKAILRSYEKKKAKDLLTEIKKALKKKEEEALNEISDYTDNWYYVTSAVTKLLDEEKRIHKWAKYVVILFALTFAMGIHASTGSQELFLGEYS
jgi:flagellar motor component MotA